MADVDVPLLEADDSNFCLPESRIGSLRSIRSPWTAWSTRKRARQQERRAAYKSR